MKTTKIWKTAVATVMVLSASTAMAAPTIDQKCEASKNKAVGAYYACREKAAAAAISKGGMADYSKCAAKFDQKWSGAETAGATMCPDNFEIPADINAFIAAQASAAAAMVAGTGSLPTCGDGLINAPGEHCDGAALDGLTCASFGLYGSLTCTAGCDISLSGCTSCPPGGIQYKDACWFLGAVAGNCDSACTGLGLVYDDVTASLAGSGGTDADCTALLEALNTPGAGLDNAGGDCAGSGFGCAVYTEFGFRGRCGTPATNSTASSTGIQRVCACR